MNKANEKVSNLPQNQQIALWIILRMPKAHRKDFRFFSHEFAERFKKLSDEMISKDYDKYGKSVGGILSGLSRNGILRKLSGGRSKLWTLSDELKNNIEQYKKLLNEVKTYWM